MNAVWVKSSRSFSNGNCVEVAELPGGSVGVRHSKDPDGPVLQFTRGAWHAFLGATRRGTSGGVAGRGLVTRHPSQAGRRTRGCRRQ
jgi:hypothetical protein